MENDKSLIPSRVLLNKISAQISLADKYLSDSEDEQWVTFFITNPSFFQLLVSLNYPFTKTELINFKSKIILGSVERGADYPVDVDEVDGEDELKEYSHDPNSFEQGAFQIVAQAA